MTRLGPLIAAVVAWSLITACHGAPPEAGDAGVPAHEAWANDPRFADGLAEVQVYDATVIREGAERAVRAYTVLVAEDLDPATLVKAERWDRPGLLRVHKFGMYFTARTGFAEFREATNVFLDAATWRAVKLVYSAQDWCGLTFKTWSVDGDDTVLRWTGYREQDGGRGDARYHDGAVAIPADAVPAWVRGLRLVEDASFSFRLLPSLQGSRVGRPEIVDARLDVLGTSQLDVPAGTFAVHDVRVRFDGGEIRLAVEREFPNRTVAWTDELGQTFRLVKSLREAYWARVDDGDEAELLP